MKKFNKTDYINELMFNVQCDGEKYHLIITEGLFAACEEKAHCKLSKEEILKLIEFLKGIEVKI